MDRSQRKKWIARSIQWSGLGISREMIAPAQLTILTYHRVLPPQEALRYPLQGMVMPRCLFEAQMACLAENYTVLRFPEAIELLRQEKLPRRSVVVTFDDGYRDNYDHAWPILQKYRIPATFFLVSGALDRKLLLWWDEVAVLVEHIQRLPSNLRKTKIAPEWMVSFLMKQQDTSRGPQVVARDVIEYMHQIPLPERRRSLQLLRGLDKSDSKRSQDLMLTWEQVRELRDSGMYIGAHTVTHAFLDELDEESARREIEGSIERIENQLEIKVRFFAYPRGRIANKFKPLLRQAGITVAVSTEPGPNKAGADLLQLKRLDAGYCRVSSVFDKAVFQTELQGWFNRFRQDEARETLLEIAVS